MVFWSAVGRGGRKSGSYKEWRSRGGEGDWGGPKGKMWGGGGKG